MKIGFLITARLKSSRLPLKILLDLEGKTIIERVINRAKQVLGITRVVLCTSENPQDSQLVDIAVRNDISYFLGDEDDVLDRLLSAAQYYNLDAFLSITADNPLFCISTSQHLLDWFQNEPKDFMFIKNLPMGCAVSLLSVKALEVVNHIKDSSITEIWGPFVKRSDFFSIGELFVKNSPFNEQRRLTLDYEEDYLLFQRIFKLLNVSPDREPRLTEVFKILESDVSLWKINEKHRQLDNSKEQLIQINNTFNSNMNSGREYASKIGLKLSPGFVSQEVFL